jgi:hypothetical protein
MVAAPEWSHSGSTAAVMAAPTGHDAYYTGNACWSLYRVFEVAASTAAMCRARHVIMTVLADLQDAASC